MQQFGGASQHVHIDDGMVVVSFTLARYNQEDLTEIEGDYEGSPGCYDTNIQSQLHLGQSEPFRQFCQGLLDKI